MACRDPDLLVKDELVLFTEKKTSLSPRHDQKAVAAATVFWLCTALFCLD